MAQLNNPELSGIGNEMQGETPSEVTRITPPHNSVVASNGPGISALQAALAGGTSGLTDKSEWYNSPPPVVRTDVESLVAVS